MIDQPNDPLAEPLRDEADRLAEPFSTELHGRIMRQVREERIVSASPATPTWWLLLAGTCAAAAVAVVILLRQQAAPVTPKQVKTDTDLAMVTQWIRDTAHPVQESVSDAANQAGEMTYLGQDVQTFGHFVMSQLNSLPEASPKDRPTEIR